MSEVFKLSEHEHYLGAKNKLFVSEEELPEMISVVMGEDSQIIANDLNDKLKNKLFTPSASLKYSGKNASLISVIIKQSDRNVFCSMVPCFDIGLVYNGDLECVNVWDNGAEAQIELSVGDYTMIFYDENFIKNRAFYEKKEVKARIYAIAFNGAFVKDETIKIEASEAHIKAGFAKKLGEKVEFHTGQMTWWLPLDDDDDCDIDEVNIRGEVKSIRKIDLELFNKKAFVATLRVFEYADNSDIEIIFTNESWNEQELPKIGDFISVYACLCGEILR